MIPCIGRLFRRRRPSFVNPAPSVASTNVYAMHSGGEVTIAGANFVAGATVHIGGVAATGVSVVSPSQITCTVPARAEGTALVLVTNPDTQTSGASGADKIEYAANPALMDLQGYLRAEDRNASTNEWAHAASAGTSGSRPIATNGANGPADASAIINGIQGVRANSATIGYWLRTQLTAAQNLGTANMNTSRWMHTLACRVDTTELNALTLATPNDTKMLLTDSNHTVGCALSREGGITYIRAWAIVGAPESSAQHAPRVALPALGTPFVVQYGIRPEGAQYKVSLRINDGPFQDSAPFTANTYAAVNTYHIGYHAWAERRFPGAVGDMLQRWAADVPDTEHDRAAKALMAKYKIPRP